MRRLAGDDPEVNEEWITDKDRFAFAYGRRRRPSHPTAGPRRRPAGSGRRAPPASWPEAIDVAVAACKAARQRGRGADRRSADPGGRVRLRQVRPRRAGHQQHRLPVAAASAEEADFLAARGGRTGHDGVSFADLEDASSVLLVCLEPEEEAGVIFLRLRKAFRKKGLAGRWTLAPYLEQRGTQDGAPAHSLRCPGDEASAAG